MITKPSRFVLVHFLGAVSLLLLPLVCCGVRAASADDAVSKAESATEAAPAAPKAVAVGEKFPGYELEDQHGNKHSLDPATQIVLISTNMELSKSVHGWLLEKPPTYLADHHIEYVSDITDMPGIISWMFAKPKMRKYPFRILLADDEAFAPNYPAEEAKLAAFELAPDRTVKRIAFLNSVAEVETMLPSQAHAVVVNETAVGAGGKVTSKTPSEKDSAAAKASGAAGAPTDAEVEAAMQESDSQKILTAPTGAGPSGKGPSDNGKN